MRLCECHGEPMLFQKDKRYTNQGGFYRCAVKHRAANKEWYDSLEGTDWLRRQLMARRASALYTRRQRHRLLAEDRRTDGSLQIEGRD